MSEQDPTSQPPQSQEPKDYESWAQGFHDGVEAAKVVEGKIWRSRLLFRTFAASVAGVWFVGMAAMAFGVGLLPIAGGAAACTFFFYVLDQTEELIKQGLGKLKTKLDLRKAEKEKKDGDDSSDSSS